MSIRLLLNPKNNIKKISVWSSVFSYKGRLNLDNLDSEKGSSIFISKMINLVPTAMLGFAMNRFCIIQYWQIKKSKILVYINMPSWQQCTLPVITTMALWQHNGFKPYIMCPSAWVAAKPLWWKPGIGFA